MRSLGQHAPDRAWRYTLVNGALLTGIYYLLPSTRAMNLLYVLVGVLTVGSLVLGVGVHRPRPRMPWLALLLGIALYVTGDIIWSVWDILEGREAPYPSVADIIYLTGYVVVIAATVMLIRATSVERDRGSWIDAAIIAIGLGTIGWIFLMAPYARDASLSIAERFVSIAYPAMDIVLVAVVARLVFTAGRQTFSFWAFVGGIACYLVADVVYGKTSLDGTYTTGNVIDACWIFGYTLWAVAALHPSMHAIVVPQPVTARGVLTVRRLALLAGAALLGPAALAIQTIRDQPLDIPVIVGASIVLFLLAIVRMTGLLHALERVLRRERIHGDAAARLVAAADGDSIHETTFDALEQLLPERARSLLAVLACADDSVTVAAARGGHAGGVLARAQVPASICGAGESRGGVIRDRDAAPLLAALGVEPAGRWLTLYPLTLQQAVRGMLVVAGQESLDAGASQGVEIVASQLALALERAELAAALHERRSEERFHALVQHASDVILVLDRDGSIRYASPSLAGVLGRQPEALLGTAFCGLLHPDDVERTRALFADVVATPRVSPPVELRLHHASGDWRDMETIHNNLLADPRVAGIVVNCRDITERKAFELQLQHQAFHDPLTGLANRALFMSRLEYASARAARHQEAIGLLFLDLDRFKLVNDSLGHDAGDLLLVEVGQRLRSCVRAEDTVARLGGDEFTILLEHVDDARDAAYVADRIVAAIQQPIQVGDHELFVTTSVGIVISSPDRGEPAGMMRDADIALYRAKARGKARYEIFDDTMNAFALERLELESDLRRAVEREEFVVHYQPRIEVASGQIEGFEALVRWQHPVRGLVAPAEFIPVAEETGLIRPIGRWVLEQACQQARLWLDAAPDDAPILVSVNLSAPQFQQPQLVEDVARVLEATGLPPELLQLEITESVIMDDAPATMATLWRLKGLGVRLAIDDFGTGYSSLSYLKRFPVDTLKVDKSFVDGLGTDGEDTAIVQAVISLAGTLGLRVAAEGVETAEQLGQLRLLECALAQGYYFARPMDALAARSLIANDREAAPIRLLPAAD